MPTNQILIVLAMSMKIENLPATLIFVNGSRKSKKIGALSKSELEQDLKLDA